MEKTHKDLLLLAFSAVFLNFLVWLPHIFTWQNFLGLSFPAGFATIYRNFDGLEYVIIGKSWYLPSTITSLPQSQPAIYFASHFPLYATFIALFATVLGFLKSMVFVSLFFTILCAFAFYFLVKNFRLTKQPLFLSLVFLVLPARWLIVHSVGSSEPVFIFFVIASIYFFLKYEKGEFFHLHLKEPLQKKSYLLLAAIFGLFAQLTRPPGILLFLSFLAYLIFKFFNQKAAGMKQVFSYLFSYFLLLLIPLALLGVFSYFSYSYNDFFAYFHSGDNIHLIFPPFSVFNQNQAWVGSIWLEDVIYIFILGFLATVTLFKQKLYPLAFFSLTYLIASAFVVHRDISRYVLPIAPFILIAFEKVLTSKEFKIVLAIIALGIYLYAQNFILANTAPYPNPQLFN